MKKILFLLLISLQSFGQLYLSSPQSSSSNISLTGQGGTTVTGSSPTFTISSTSTPVSLSGGGITTISGVSPTFTISSVETQTLSIGSNTITISGTNSKIDLGIKAPQYGGTGIANNSASTFSISGAFPTTFTISAATGVALPTSGTLYGTAAGSIPSSQFLSSLTDETGTGANVFGTTPTFTTSVVGGTSFDVFNTASTTINSFGAATNLAIGSTATAAQTINLGTTTTGASTLNMFSGSTTNGTTKTINIGTAGVSGSITNINIGSAVSGATGTITSNENHLFTKHTGLGGTATISTTNLLNIGETFASGSGAVAIMGGTLTLNTSANDAMTGLNVNTVLNATGGSTTHTLIGATNLTAIGGSSTANFAAGAFKGQTIRMRTITGQTGTITDATYLELSAGTWGAGKPTTIMGLNILNLGISGTTTSTGILIAAQSGSTSNYAIASASGNLHGFGTTIPVQCVDISGNLQLKTVGNKIIIKEGSGGYMGQTALVSGTKAITVTGVTTSTRCFTQRVTPSGVTLTVGYDCSCTSNTVTIQADVAAGTINTADGSTMNYILYDTAP